MALLQYILPVLVSCFTGWLVVWVITKLLFRPVRPVSVLGIKVQGIIPANQNLLAEKTGKLVGSQLFSFEALKQKVSDPENFSKLKPEIEQHIDSFLRDRLKETFPMLSVLIGDKTINQLKTAFLAELESLFPGLMKSYVNNLEKDINIEKEVTEKIAGFSIARAEELIYSSAGKQLLKLRLLGACVGFLTGLIQVLINTQLFH